MLVVKWATQLLGQSPSARPRWRPLLVFAPALAGIAAFGVSPPAEGVAVAEVGLSASSDVAAAVSVSVSPSAIASLKLLPLLALAWWHRYFSCWC